jgi:hypothetical protein
MNPKELKINVTIIIMEKKRRKKWNHKICVELCTA